MAARSSRRKAGQRRGLHLFVLPPRSPKLNGSVERPQRTHTEEFYQVTPCLLEMKKLNRELRQWEKIYNTVRPHQSLGYLTPQHFLLRGSSQRKEFIHVVRVVRSGIPTVGNFVLNEINGNFNVKASCGPVDGQV